MSDALTDLTAPKDANLLVGYETSDDAAVYRLSADIAMINTIDFITPPVDDPYWFGQIAAANSISDVYSMGGKPLTALNVVMFPAKKLDMGLMREILRSGNDKVMEAGACLVGGHSVEDDEPKYGLCVNGSVHPDKILTNNNAQDGDALILTKPLGSGVLFNAVRSGRLSFHEIEKEVLPSLAALNGPAIETAIPFPINSCTDITGFGIIGHAMEMAVGSGVRITLQYNKLPFYPVALNMYKKGENTGSNRPNRKMVEDKLEIGLSLSEEQEELLYDPQTSGGLLLSLPGEMADKLLQELHAKEVGAAVHIGYVTKGVPGVLVE